MNTTYCPAAAYETDAETEQRLNDYETTQRLRENAEDRAYASQMSLFTESDADYTERQRATQLSEATAAETEREMLEDAMPLNDDTMFDIIVDLGEAPEYVLTLRVPDDHTLNFGAFRSAPDANIAIDAARTEARAHGVPKGVFCIEFNGSILRTFPY